MREPKRLARRGALVFFLISIAVAATGDAQQANPAVVTGTSSGGVGYVTSSGGTGGINANIGRWDTPYPYGQNGPPLYGAEPYGASIFFIDVDVNDGGIANFNYTFRTYDAGIWDWLDIYVVTPTGIQTIVSHLGKPGSDYGTYFEGSMVPVSFQMNPWRNQHIQFVFSVQQDGWGDQTQASVLNFGLRTCAVPPLTPITDPAAQQFEAGQRVVYTGMTATAYADMNCFLAAVQAAGGTAAINSAYRPPAYQLHLQNVWDTWQLIRNRREAECTQLRQQVQQEMTNHAIRERPAGARGPHTQGIAFDATVDVPATVSEADLAAGCGLTQPRPDPAGGHHFQVQ